jgi:hypothetical protein
MANGYFDVSGRPFIPEVSSFLISPKSLRNILPRRFGVSGRGYRCNKTIPATRNSFDKGYSVFSFTEDTPKPGHLNGQVILSDKAVWPDELDQGVFGYQPLLSHKS